MSSVTYFWLVEFAHNSWNSNPVVHSICCRIAFQTKQGDPNFLTFVHSQEDLFVDADLFVRILLYKSTSLKGYHHE